MKKILFILFSLIYTSINAEVLQGNLVFYGRGQRNLPKYWSEIKDIEVSKKSKVFFPYYKYDSDPNYTGTDEAKNYPLTIYLQGKENDEEYSEVKFKADKSGFINFADYSYLKSEMKIRIPEVKYLKQEEYLCENIGLSCIDIEEYNFQKTTEWLDSINLKIFFESEDEINNKKIYELEFDKLTTDWKEIRGNIQIDKSNTNIKYTNLIFRNYGKMPVYLSLGNTIFVKSDDTLIIKNGNFTENFENWSWFLTDEEGKGITVYENEVCPLDSEKKNSIYCATKESYNYGIKVKIGENIHSFGPPEAISFKYRPMNDILLNFAFNKQLTLSVNEYLNGRGCRFKTEQETTILLDIKYYVLLDSKTLMNNEVESAWIQTVTNIEAIKSQILSKTKNETLRDEYVEELYFYDLTFHNTYPTNLEPYTLDKLYSNEPCDVSLHSYNSILSAKRRWPDDIKFEKIYNSKNIAKNEENELDNKTSEISSSHKNSYKYSFIINISIFIIIFSYYIL
eukprot:jgi/Orpsp1_1/1176801/evm.model.c7180000059077.1